MSSGSDDRSPRSPELGSAPTVAPVGTAPTIASAQTLASIDPVAHTAPSGARGPSGLDSEQTMAAPERAAAGVTPDQMVTVHGTLYERLDELARGGLGRITRARDLRSGRIVAIKEVLSRGGDDAVIRFAREAMITANLQHPAIVPVYEVGRWPSGEPFYAMKLVSGRPLNAVIEATRDLDGRLALVGHVLTVADALAYAHGNGVIHRDLKPHNVLVGAHGETVVIDWGLARRTSDRDAPATVHRRISAEPGQTYLGAVMGTPAYMPPEQARGQRVDERADVYAIGALLYHVLAGTPPYAGKSLDQVIEHVISGPPRALPEVVPAVPRDLVAIVERAMAANPEARYRSAAELATDLRRFTTGQLVLAHQYTLPQRVRRYVARHRAAVLVATVAAAALVIGGAIAFASVVRARDDARSAQGVAERAQRRADDKRDEAQRRLIAAHVDRARVELTGERPRAALAFAAAAAEVGGLDPTIRYLAARALDGIPAGRLFPELDMAAVEFVAGSQDLLVSSSSTLVRWDAAADRRLWERATNGADVLRLDDRRVAIPDDTGLAIVDVATGKELERITGPQMMIGSTAIDRTRRWIAVRTPETLELFDVAAKRHTTSVRVADMTRASLVSDDGTRFVVVVKVSERQERILLVERSGRVLQELCGDCRSAFPTPTGFAVVNTAVSGPPRVMFRAWSGASQGELQPASLADVNHLVYDEGGRRFAMVMSDGIVEVHEVGKGLRWRYTVPNKLYEAKFDPRGRLWVLGAYSTTHLFDAETGAVLARWDLGGLALRVSDDGLRAAVATARVGVTSWSARATAVVPLAPTPQRLRHLTFLDDARLLTGSDDGSLILHERGQPDRALGKHGARLTALQVTPDGKDVMVSSRDGTVVVRSIATGQELERYPQGPIGELSPDGKRIAVLRDDAVFLIDRATQHVRELGKLPEAVSSVRWVPDGSKVAAIDQRSNVVLWRTDGTVHRELSAGGEIGIDLVFSPDGKWFGKLGFTTRDALYAIDGDARYLEPAARMRSLVPAIVFTPDSRRVAMSDQGRVRMWSVETGTLAAEIATGTDVTALAISADGSTLYGGGIDRMVRVWELPRGALLYAMPATGEVYGLVFDAARRRLAILTLGSAMLWSIADLALEVPTLRTVVDCALPFDPVTGTSHVVDTTACNRLAQ